MTRTITALCDRLLSVVAPKATAKAASCSEVWCYCSGHWGVYQKCCYNGTTYSCGNCRRLVAYECA
jgi:hypothetical protein